MLTLLGIRLMPLQVIDSFQPDFAMDSNRQLYGRYCKIEEETRRMKDTTTFKEAWDSLKS